MQDILNYHKLKLLYTRNNLLLKDSSQTGWNLSSWVRTGGEQAWHIMTTDTNEDKSTGLDGNIALHSAGAWHPGSMEREIILKDYSEILFEHYLKNEDVEHFKNKLAFYVDEVMKLEVTGPSPWQRCIPIGITPGKHKIKFDYEAFGDFAANKGVVDTVMVWESKPVNCLITDYNPPSPSRNLGKNKVLRGYTRYQDMTVADTEIKFSAVFNGQSFLEFMQKSNEPFYFVDEFGICYRGIFPDNVEPKNIAMNELYSVELTMIAGQKTGFGFC